MKQIRIGDVTIDAVIEREGPWRRPRDFFPAHDEAVFRHHLPSMESEVWDEAQGKIVITYQTFVVRTPRYTILVDTCTGEDKGHPPVPTFPNAKYIFHKREYAVWEAEHAKANNPPGTVFRDNCLPIVEAGQALWWMTIMRSTTPLR